MQASKILCFSSLFMSPTSKLVCIGLIVMPTILIKNSPTSRDLRKSSPGPAPSYRDAIKSLFERTPHWRGLGRGLRRLTHALYDRCLRKAFT
ncbi:hypothetical protein CDL15_Pgr005229 [Punica granatum]|uniref:Uncharacterized protein n=1 Tax=Punica granatum TaxID=22663 RepID=A0A218WQ80_PUNGR|nr:hypothetical protein CDL15_Pgr005229 [Punica granatum]